MSSSNQFPVIVLGGGISGLTAARILQEQDRDYLLLERCPTLGGLTRTVEVGEFCFDYTGHFLHLCRYPTPQAIPYANLKDDEWTQIHRDSRCFVGGKMISAPIQYHLNELPSALFVQCVNSYNSRPNLSDRDDTTFRDYIVSGFGQALADLFLIPQNEKTIGHFSRPLVQACGSPVFPRSRRSSRSEGNDSRRRRREKLQFDFLVPQNRRYRETRPGIAIGNPQLQRRSGRGFPWTSAREDPSHRQRRAFPLEQHVFPAFP